MIELVSKVARHLLPRQDTAGQSDLQFDQNASTGDKFLSLIAGGFTSQLQGQTIIVAILASFLLTILMVLLFCFVRPHNTIVYAPRAKHADSKHAPPPIGKGPFAWIMPLVRTKEEDLIEKVGLDAAIFLRFIRMLRNIFGVISILGCGILIPLALANQQKGIPSTVSFINRITPLYMGWGSNIYWGHVVVSYLFDLVVCFFLWINYRAVFRLRRRYMESSEYQKSLHARTLLVTDIPKQYRSEEGIIRIADEVRGTQAVPRAAIARNVKDLPDLVEEHEKTVRELERVLAKYLKNPDRLPAQRPTCKPSKKDKAHSSGQRVDAIDYLTSRIKELEHEIKEVRVSVDNRNALGYGFASYQNIIDAHSVAYLARNKAPHDTNITLAPKPTSLIWKNLKLSKKERNWSNFINNVWILVLTLVWFVPNVLIAVFLSNLANIGLLWPAFQQNIEQNLTAWSLVQAIAAPAITSLFYFYLPAIFRKLRNNAGDITKTQRERHVVHKLFAFFLVNNLIIFSLFSTLFGFFAALAKDKSIGANEVFQNLFAALVASTTYWMSWLLQRNLGAAIDLSQIINLSWGSLMRRFGSPTPRETIELTAPQPFDYAAYYNYFLFYTAVGLTFATLQPLVLPVVLLYFWIDSFVKKYMLLYIFITKHESGGMFWRTLFNRVLIATVLGNIVVALLVVARTSSGAIRVNWQMLAALVPLPILLILFKWYCSRTFDTEMHFYQTGKALLDSEMQGESEPKRRGDRVGVRFGHPVLYKPLITPMVSSKSQHLLKSIYTGRTSFDDNASVAGFSDVFMDPMQPGRPGKAVKNAPFEFVDENNMDFEHYKNRPEFRDQAGGDGQLFGRAPDMSRPGTPGSMTTLSRADTADWEGHSRDNSDQSYSKGNSNRHSQYGSREHSQSRDSSLTRVPDVGVEYPRGYHQTPSNLREQSPGGMGYDSFRGRGYNLNQTRSRDGLVNQAAPMAQATPYAPAPGGYSMAGTPGYETPGEETSYDYFRRGRQYH